MQSAVNILNLNEQQERLLNKIASSTAIGKRHTVLSDFLKGSYCGSTKGQPFPTTGIRNDLYKEMAPQLAQVVCEKALSMWGGDRNAITHVISVSCTGMIAPGIEYLMIRPLGLSSKVQRLGINFMGCFGAFKGLAIARSIALENPNHRVLVVCTELCSLHFQQDFKMDTLVANSIFADGAAAVVVGANPQNEEKPLFVLQGHASHAVDETLDLMTWEVCDSGYQMRLSASVPAQLESHIAPFARDILGPDLSFEECTWAIHPGGKAILEGITRACSLQITQTAASWKVLNEQGNMSSPTFLFVLKEILQNPKVNEWVIGLGFGPGLSIEGMLLKHVAK